MIVVQVLYILLYMKRNKEYIKVGEGVYLAKQANSDKYSYYFRVGGVKFRKSTRTKDLNSAMHIALEAFDTAKQKKKAGKDVKSVSFKELANRHLESLKGQGRYEYHSKHISRHLMPFFKKFDDVSKINQGTLIDYLNYRRNKSNVKDQTLNRENGVLNQILRLGYDYEILSKELKCKHCKLNGDVKRRPNFTAKEYNKLCKIAFKRAKEFKPIKGDRKSWLNLTNYWKRLLLHNLIILLANTGLRVDELSTVRWCDIDFEDNSLKLVSAGKTKSSRKAFIRRSGITVLESIKNRRLEYIKEHSCKEFDEKERIQTLPNGTFVKSMKKGFKALLKDCDLLDSDLSKRYTLTSLRHSYATFALTRKAKEDRVSVRALSKQMGTSTLMIEKHYGHDSSSDYKETLLK